MSGLGTGTPLVDNLTTLAYTYNQDGTKAFTTAGRGALRAGARGSLRAMQAAFRREGFGG